MFGSVKLIRSIFKTFLTLSVIVLMQCKKSDTVTLSKNDILNFATSEQLDVIGKNSKFWDNATIYDYRKNDFFYVVNLFNDQYIEYKDGTLRLENGGGALPFYSGTNVVAYMNRANPKKLYDDKVIYSMDRDNSIFDKKYSTIDWNGHQIGKYFVIRTFKHAEKICNFQMRKMADPYSLINNIEGDFIRLVEAKNKNYVFYNKYGESGTLIRAKLTRYGILEDTKIINLDSRFYYNFINYDENEDIALFYQQTNKENFPFSKTTILKVSFKYGIVIK